MSIIVPPNSPAQVSPRAICPTCGLSTNNATVRRSEHAAIATFICTEAHLFTVTWVEVP